MPRRCRQGATAQALPAVSQCPGAAGRRLVVLIKLGLKDVVNKAAAMASYREAPLASRPCTLDPKGYLEPSAEERRAQEERLAIRARLKLQYLRKLNDPRRTELMQDPAVTRWVYARTLNHIYPNFRPSPKTSLLGFVCGVVPLIFWYYVFKTDRDHKEKCIREGMERPFSLSI
ncbi:NADH dehydrogenase [ubiquinone] 1 beta subcomplex subunit 4 [Narcine bancroftii]|uniref:NADH dehydrogenase [ubiquinone] 1 beta subcomplex subunit 4 n=1 Tax=Narcine bancroftii TaxID=1343680 RepID=UPI0038316D9E